MRLVEKEKADIVETTKDAETEQLDKAYMSHAMAYNGLINTRNVSASCDDHDQAKREGVRIEKRIEAIEGQIRQMEAEKRYLVESKLLSNLLDNSDVKLKGCKENFFKKVKAALEEFSED